MIPRHCREVSVKKVPFDLTAENILKAAAGKSAYLKTGYIVFNNGNDWAVTRVEKAREEALFQRIQKLDIVALPRDTAYLERPEVDVQDASAMVRLLEDTGKDALVVKGKFEHISFVYKEKTTPLFLFDVVPPNPPKIVELAEAALATGRIRKPIRLVPRIVDLGQLARTRGTEFVMFPCYAASLAGKDEKSAYYLDQVPGLKAPAERITLIGCELSLRIFTSVYGQEPAHMELCPKKSVHTVAGPCLCRCCVVDEGHTIEDNAAFVPWGASIGEVEEAIIDLLGLELEQTL